MQALKRGASTCEVSQVHDESVPGVSKSNASRHRQAIGEQFVGSLRNRDLSQTDWAILLLDGIHLSRDPMAIVAVGIDAGGNKQVLDFELGSTESTEICRGLMRWLMKRGIHCERMLLSVLGRSDTLRRALKELFPDVLIQRCLVHKERKIRAKLSKRHWGELARLFKRLREVQGPAAAEAVLQELKAFLQPINAHPINAVALASLEEAGEELTALHSLNVPNTLRRNLLSTNAIENSIRRPTRVVPAKCRWTSIAQPITRLDKSSNSIFVLFVSFVVPIFPRTVRYVLSGER